ncbi:unnamed protein product [Boreogadus saida]
MLLRWAHECERLASSGTCGGADADHGLLSSGPSRAVGVCVCVCLGSSCLGCRTALRATTLVLLCCEGPWVSHTEPRLTHGAPSHTRSPVLSTRAPESRQHRSAAQPWF